jgi:hypothetical protein
MTDFKLNDYIVNTQPAVTGHDSAPSVENNTRDNMSSVGEHSYGPPHEFPNSVYLEPTPPRRHVGMKTVHTVTKEYNAEKHSNASTYIVLAILGVLVIIVIVWFFFYSNKSSFATLVSTEKSKFDPLPNYKPDGTVYTDALGKCGWIVFTMKGCGWCDKQKADLAANYPTFAGIKDGGPVSGFPTWYNTKTYETVPGYQPPEKLAAMAKC